MFEVKSGHSKKLNVGLLYEFLVRETSKSLVDGDSSRAHRAVSVAKRWFRSGTELNTEFRLINSLVRTTVSSESVASNILREAREAARTRNVDKLAVERKSLSREVERAFGQDAFEHNVEEYRAFATAQTLLDEWRKGDRADLGTIAKFEDSMTRWLLEDKRERSIGFMNSESPGTNRLLVRTMSKKIEEKYGRELDSVQKSIVRTCALSEARRDDSASRKLDEVKAHVTSTIDEYVSKNRPDDSSLEMLTRVREKVVSEDTSRVTDEVVVRFLEYAELASELCSEVER